jgi:hypothetical protein
MDELPPDSAPMKRSSMAKDWFLRGFAFALFIAVMTGLSYFYRYLYDHVSPLALLVPIGLCFLWAFWQEGQDRRRAQEGD